LRERQKEQSELVVHANVAENFSEVVAQPDGVDLQVFNSYSKGGLP
jgi:hypothetical protein